MAMFLETDRLVLREFTTDDVENLVDLDSDPEVVHFITGGEPTPRTEVEDKIIPRFLRFHAETPGYGFWAIEDKASGQFLGWVHFRPGEGHGPDEPELGYRLRRSAWGKGYATEASRAVINRGFRDLPIQRVLAETMVVNTASRRVMEHCGMRPARFFHADWPVRIPGDEHGDVEYELDRSTWERLQA